MGESLSLLGVSTYKPLFQFSVKSCRDQRTWDLALKLSSMPLNVDDKVAGVNRPNPLLQILVLCDGDQLVSSHNA